MVRPKYYVQYYSIVSYSYTTSNHGIDKKYNFFYNGLTNKALLDVELVNYASWQGALYV
jgi:hypothetical protein